jgi:hypothetical protein
MKFLLLSFSALTSIAVASKPHLSGCENGWCFVRPSEEGEKTKVLFGSRLRNMDLVRILRQHTINHTKDELFK